MRRFPISWDKTLTSLGFRRNVERIKRNRYGRKSSRLEQLEIRAMLSADPVVPVRPEYVIVQSDTEESDPPPFTLLTEYDADGTPRAVLGFDGDPTENVVHEVSLELRLDDLVLESQEIAVNLTRSEFESAFRADRIRAVSEQVRPASVEEIQGWLAELTVDGEFPSVEADPQLSSDGERLAETASRLAAMADYHRIVGYLLHGDASKSSFYAGIQRVASGLPSIDNEYLIETTSDDLGRVALLHGDQLTEDLADSGPLALSALATRDALLSAVSSYYTVLGVYGVDTDLTRTIDDADVERAVAVVEDGVFVLGDSLRVEVVGYRAFVEATVTPELQTVAFLQQALTLSGPPVVEDVHYTPYQSPAVNDLETIEIATDSAGVATSSGRLRIDLDQHDDRIPSSAKLTVTPTDLGTVDPSQVALNYRWDAWGLTYDPFTNDGWIEDSQDQITPAVTAQLNGDDLEFDVTEAVQRSLLLGDADADGAAEHSYSIYHDLRGLARDVNATYLAIRDWDTYAARHADRSDIEGHLLYRTDANWDGKVSPEDGELALERLGVPGADFNLDGAVGVDDLAAYQLHFGQVAHQFADGDADFNGIVNADDRAIWEEWDYQGTEFAFYRPAEPHFELTLSEAGTTLDLHSTESTTANYKPSLSLEYNNAELHIELDDTFAPSIDNPGLVNGEISLRYGSDTDVLADAKASLYRVPAGSDTPVLLVGNVPLASTTAGETGLHYFSSNDFAALEAGDRLLAKVNSVSLDLQRTTEMNSGIILAGSTIHVLGTDGVDQIEVLDDRVNVRYAASGSTAPVSFEFSAVQEAIVITARGGDDRVNVHAGFSGEITFDGGQGDEWYAFDTTGADDRTLSFNDTQGRNVWWIEANDVLGKPDVHGLDDFDVTNPSQQVVEFEQYNDSFSLESMGTYAVNFGNERAITILRAENEADFQVGDLGLTSYTVDVLADIDDDRYGVGELSLREAVRLANATPRPPVDLSDPLSEGKVEIGFDPSLFVNGDQQIVLTDGAARSDDMDRSQLRLSQSLLIDGPDSQTLTISGAGETRIFMVDALDSVTLRDLVIADGYVDKTSDGGALYVSGGGDLLLERTVWKNNQTVGHNDWKGGQGGAIFAKNTNVTIIDSEFEGNDARYGGAIYYRPDGGQNLIVRNSTLAQNLANRRSNNGGYGSALAFESWSTTAGSSVRLENSTLSDNFGKLGGTIYVRGSGSTDRLTIEIVGSTITANRVDGSFNGGAGLYNASNGATTLYNTILADNIKDADETPSEQDLFIHNTSRLHGSHNLIGYSPQGENTIRGRLPDSEFIGSSFSTDAGLFPLSYNGGLTKTHALFPDSVAVDRGDLSLDAALRRDQRGFPGYGERVDIGAFEYQEPLPLVVTTTADANAGLAELSLRHALELAALRPGSDTITFDPTLFGIEQSILLGDADGNGQIDAGETPTALVIDSEVTVVGPGADLLTIDARGASSVFEVTSSVGPEGADISGVALTGSAFAGITVFQSRLALTRVEISAAGTGLFALEAELEIRDSTVAENAAGGLHLISGTVANVYNSTISNNSTTSSDGAGVYVDSSTFSATNTTVAANQTGAAGRTGGIYSFGSTIDLRNTIVAANSSGVENIPSDIGANVSQDWSGSYNLIGLGSELVSGIEDQVDGNLVGTTEPIDAGLAPLANHGGSVRTHAIAPSSVAANAGSNAVALAAGLLYDQRGNGHDRLRGQRVDIGAFEVQGILVTTHEDGDAATPGELTLRQAIEQAEDGQLITFAKHLDGAEIALGPQSDLLIDKSLTIDAGNLPGGLTIRAYDPDLYDDDFDESHRYNANGGRSFLIEGRDTEVTLRGLTLTGGDSWHAGGAIRALDASLTLEGVTVAHNAAPRQAGPEVLGRTGFIDYPRDDPQNFAPICGEYQLGATAGGVFTTGDLTVIDSRFVNNAQFDWDQSLAGHERLCSAEVGSGYVNGEIFAADIHAYGDLTIIGSTFEKVPVADGEPGIDPYDTNNHKLAFGGIYSTNRRNAPSSDVVVRDTEFKRTRGLVVDAAAATDLFNRDSEIERRAFDYEFRLYGGYLNRSGVRLEPDARGVYSISKADLDADTIQFRHVDEDETDEELAILFDEDPHFEVRRTFGNDVFDAWTRVPVEVVSNGDSLPSNGAFLYLYEGQSRPISGVNGLKPQGVLEPADVEITNVNISDAEGEMVLKYRDSWDDEDVEPALGGLSRATSNGAIVLFWADALIDGVTLGSSEGTAINAIRSDVTVENSRFLAPESLDLGRGYQTISARAGDLTVRDSLFHTGEDRDGDHVARAIYADVHSPVLIERSTFFDHYDNVIVIENPWHPEYEEVEDGDKVWFAGSLTLRDSVVMGTKIGYNFDSRGAVSVDTNVYPLPPMPTCDPLEDEECDPDDPEFVEAPHFSVTSSAPYRVTIDGSTIANNRSAYGQNYGAGLSLSGPIDAYIVDSTFSGNRMFYHDPNDPGSGLADLADAANPETGIVPDHAVPGVQRESEIGGSSGGAIGADGIRSLRIENSTISDNQAAQAGGGIYAVNTGRIELINTTITGNEAGYQGGGVFVVPGPLRNELEERFFPSPGNAAFFVNTIIAGNKAWDFDTSIFAGNEDHTDLSLSGSGNGIFAIHSENTHDVWFAVPNSVYIDDGLGSGGILPIDYHPLSRQSSNNIIGVGVDPNLTTGGADPLLPIQDSDEGTGKGDGIDENIVGVLTRTGAIDPQLTPLGDYGGPSELHAIRLGGATASPALDAGFWNAPTGKPEDELIRPVTVDSSTAYIDAGAAYNLVSEASTLRDSDAISYPLTDADRLAGIDGRKWVSAIPDPERAFRAPALTFGFNGVREIDRIVLWGVSTPGGNSTLPDQLQLSYSNDGGDTWTELTNATPVWDTDAEPGDSLTIMLDGGSYLSAELVRLAFPTYVGEYNENSEPGSQFALSEVRFGGKRQFDQRGKLGEGPDGGFDRKAGPIDIGAYESPTEYAMMPTLPSAVLLGGDDPAAYDLVPTDAADTVDRSLDPGELSLREAILLSNIHDGTQQIGLHDSVGDGHFLLSRGELLISDSTTIEGFGGATNGPTIDASGTYVPLPEFDSFPPPDLPGDPSAFAIAYTNHSLVTAGSRNVLGSRVINIDDDNQDVTIDVELTGLVLTGGYVFGSGGGVRSTENLELFRSDIVGNFAGSNLPHTIAELRQVGFFELTFPETIAPRGGGVFSDGGDLTVRDSRVVGNTTNIAGGGIHAEDGEIEIVGSEIRNNLVRLPNNLFYYTFEKIKGDLTVDKDVRGGGLSIDSSNNAVIDSSVISGNIALASDGIYYLNTEGEAVFDHYFHLSLFGEASSRNIDSRSSFGGGVYVEGSAVVVTNTEISGNEAYVGAGSYVRGKEHLLDGVRTASGPYVNTSTTFVNTTISNNYARVRPIESDRVTMPRGGGIAAAGDADVALYHSTVTENEIVADPGVTEYNLANNGGAGIYFPDTTGDYSGTFLINHSIVAGNYGPSRFNPAVDATSINYGSLVGKNTDSADIHFGQSSLINNMEALRNVLRIDHSIIGTNDSLTYGNGFYSPVELVGNSSGTIGYFQSVYVSSTDENVDLAWQDGGVPAEDEYGNLIGGPAIGMGKIGPGEFRYYGGPLDPGLDVLAANGGFTGTGAAIRTHAPLASGANTRALIRPDSVSYTDSYANSGGSLPLANPLIEDRIVGFDHDKTSATSIDAGVLPLTVPYVGAGDVLRQRIQLMSWQTAEPAPSSPDYFTSGAADPEFEFDLGGTAELSEIIVWSAINSIFQAGDEAREFEVRFFKDDLPVGEVVTLTREAVPTIAGASESLLLPERVIADEVHVRIAGNFYGFDNPNNLGSPVAGGDQVELGQIRFVGELLSGFGVSDTSTAIDAGDDTFPPHPIEPGTLDEDQRGQGYSRFVGDAVDIGAHETGAQPNQGGAPTVELLNPLPQIIEGVYPDGLKVAELRIGNLANSPWTAQFVQSDVSDLFFIPTDEQGRQLRELWIKPGAEVDFESLYDEVDGAFINLELTVTDPSQASNQTSSSVSFSGNGIPVVNVNDLPTLDADPPAITLASDVTPTTNPGVSVQALLAGASDDDVGPANELGMAIVGVGSNEAPDSVVEYSFDDGGTWFVTPSLVAGEVFLLPREALVRFNKQDDFTGTVEDVILFRVWDGTKGVVAEIAKVADVSDSLSLPLGNNEWTGGVDVVITPQVGSPTEVTATAVDATSASVAVDPRGVGLHVWQTASGLHAQRVATDGTLLGEAVEVTDNATASSPHAVATSDGGLIVVWEQGNALYTRRFDLNAGSLTSAGSAQSITLASGGLSALTYVPADDSFVMAWDNGGDGYFGQYRFDSASPISVIQPESLPTGTEVAVAVTDSQDIHLAWTQNGNVYKGRYDGQAIVDLDLLSTAAASYPSEAVPNGSRTISDVHVAIGGNGDPVYSWLESVDWTIAGDATGTTTTAYYVDESGIEPIGSAEQRTPTEGQATGSRISGVTLAADRDERVGVAWTETQSTQASSSLLLTRWYNAGHPDEPYTQIVDGVWSNPRLAASGPGEFNLTATREAGDPDAVVSQRFVLSSLNQAAWDFDGERFGVRAGSDLTDPLVVSTGVYGGVEYLTVNGDLTTTAVAEVLQIDVVTGSADDRIDLTGLAASPGLGADVEVNVSAGAGDDEIFVGSGDVTVDGGAGNDKYYLPNDAETTLTVADESGDDRLVLDGWGADKAVIVLGFAGLQRISAGTAATIQLNLTGGDDIEHVDHTDGMTLVEDSTLHSVFKPSEKAAQLDGGGALVVNSTDQAIDLGDGSFSLSEALLWAKTDAKADVITFDGMATTAPLSLPYQLLIDTAVTIDGEDSVSLRGSGTDRIFEIAEGVGATLRDIELQNGSADTGGAIYSAGDLTLSGVTISGSGATAGDGGAVMNAGGRLTIRGSWIKDNTASSGGGAVASTGDSPEVSITTSSFENNRADQGGGLYATSGEVSINRSSFTWDDSTLAIVVSGGGLFVGGDADIAVTNTTLSGNRATSGGAAYFSTSVSPNLTNVTVAFNEADDGAGLYVTGAQVIAVKTLFADNRNSASTLTTIGGTANAFAADTTTNLIESVETNDVDGGLVGGMETDTFADDAHATVLNSGLLGETAAPKYHALELGASPAALSGGTTDGVGVVVDVLGNVPSDNVRDIGAFELGGQEDTAPSDFPLVTGTISEGAPSNTIAAIAVATPQWRGFDYSITAGNEDGAFAIDSASGTIRVVDSSLLDAESKPAYLLSINAETDVPGQEKTGYVRILVTSVNESPLLGAARSFQLAKSAKLGDTVGYVTGFDPDVGDVLTYVISGSSAVKRAVEIDEDTGEITVLDPAELQGLDALDFTVVAEDNAGLKDSVEVRVELFEISLLDPNYDGGETIAGTPVDRPEPIVVVGTTPDAPYSVSHRKELVFNPLATVINSPGKEYRVEYLRDSGSTALSVTYSAAGTLLSGADKSASLGLGKLTVRQDGALIYKPNDDLVADNELTTPGPGGSYYYAIDRFAMRVIDTSNGEVLLDDHPAQIAVTNTLPVFRSEYIGGPDVTLTLDELIVVRRHTTYTIDLGDLLYDADGDPILVSQFISENTLVDHFDDPRIYDANANPDNFPADALTGDESISAGFGFKLSSNGPSGIRSLTLSRTAGPSDASDDIIAIQHDGEISDNDPNNFTDATFNKTFTFTVSVTDGQLSDEETISSSVALSLRPWNTSNTTIAGTTEAAWLASAKHSQDAAEYPESAELAPAEWSLAAKDIQAGREGAELEVVGNALVDLVDGSLIRRHALTLDGSGGGAEATLPGLVYDSATADPRPVIEATLVAPSDFADNFDEDNIESFTARFTWYDHVNTEGGAPRELVTEVFYDTASEIRKLDFDEPLRFAFQPPETPLFTGVYRWKVEFDLVVDSDLSSFDETITLTQGGETTIVVQKKVTADQFGDASPTKWDYTPQFGDGWALEGVPQLFVDDYRGASVDDEADDRFILWFPGQQLRVFGIGNVELQTQRQDYGDNNPNTFGTFAPLNTQTGFVDPLEYGTLRENSITLFGGVTVDAIIYTTPGAVDYVFTRSGTSNEPAWLLQEIRDPQADRPIQFEYADGNGIPEITLERITGTDSASIDISSSGGSTKTVVFELDGGTARTELEVNAAYNQLGEIKHKDAASSLDRVRNFTYDGGTDLLQTDSWDDSELETSFTFNSVGQLTNVIHGSANHRVETAFEGAVTTIDASNVVQSVWSVDPNDAKLLDATRVATTSVAHSGNDGWHTRHTFDVEGNRVQTEAFLGSIGVVKDRVSLEAWTHDHLGAVKSYLDPVGRASYFRHDYQTPASQATNPSADTSGAYDSDDYRGNVTRIDSFSGATRFEYSTDDGKFGAIGRLVRQVDPNGLETRRVWNRYGQLLELHVGDDYSEVWTYDDATGRLDTHTDARGLETTYEYADADARLPSDMVEVDQGAAGVTGETRRTEYTYDDNGYLSNTTVEVDDNVLSFTYYDYDRTGLLRTLRVGADGSVNANGSLANIDDELLTQQYTYYDDGLVHVETVGSANDKRVTTYEYDGRGLVESVARKKSSDGSGSNVTTTYAYHGDGRLNTTTLSDGTVITETYTVVLGAGDSFATGEQRNELRQTTKTTKVAGTNAYSSGSNPYTEPAGSQTVHRYFDEAGRLLEADNRLIGANTEYRYSDLRHDAATTVAESVNLGGSVADTVYSSFVYDIQGNVVYEAAPGQSPVAYKYNDIGYLLETNVLARQGARRVYDHNDAGDVIKETEVRKQPDGSVVAFATEYTYDESGRLREIKDNADASGGARTSTINYNVGNHFAMASHATLDSIVTREVLTTSLEGVTTKQYFDGAGQIVREVNAYGGVTDHTYNQRGLLSRTTERTPTPSGDRITTFEYDGLGRSTRVVQHGQAIDALIDGVGELITTTAYNDGATGWDMTVTDPHGVQTYTEYDSLGNLVAMREGNGSADHDLLVLNSYHYDNGSATVVVTTRTTSPRAQAEINNAERQHDETSVSRQLLNTRGDVLVSGVRVAGLGSSDTVASDIFDDNFRIEQANTYGEHGRMVSQSLGNDNKTLYAYDIALSGVLAVSSIQRPDERAGETTTRYRYDSAGNRVSQDVDDGNQITWNYDQAGRVTSESITLAGETIPDTRTWSYNGLATTRTDRNNDEVVTTFDPSNKQTTVAGPGYSATFTYHADGSLQKAEDTQGRGFASSVEYTYDEYGRLDSETSKHTIGSIETTSVVDVTAYNDNGIRQAATWSFGGTTVNNTYDLDARGRVHKVGQGLSASGWAAGVSPNDKAIELLYNADGRRDTLNRFDNAAGTGAAIGHTIYRYNDDGGLGRLSHGRDAFSDNDAAVIAEHRFDYDQRGLIHGIDSSYRNAAGEVLSGSQNGHKFNDRGELLNVGAPEPSEGTSTNPHDSSKSSRDAEGNALVGGVTYDPNNQNRIASLGGDAFVYDDEGRLITGRGGVTYTWDHRGLLEQVEVGGPGSDVVEFYYDVLGRKVVRRELSSGSALASDTRYAWDGDDLAGEVDAIADEVTRVYFNGPGVNEVLAVEQFAVDDSNPASVVKVVDTLWQFADQVGTSTTVGRTVDGGGWELLHRSLDTNGLADTFPLSDPDGTPTGLLGSVDSDLLLASPTIYAGHHFDATLGHYDMRARWYDPETHQFLSEDPLGQAGSGTNLYLYAGGDAVNYLDPDGRKALVVPGSGHHLIPWEFISSDTYSFSREVQAIWNSDEARISGRWFASHDSRTLDGVTHPSYNRAVEEALDDFLRSRRIDGSDLSRRDAKRFLDYVKAQKPDTTIGRFNIAVKLERDSARALGDALYDERVAEARKSKKDLSSIGREVQEEVKDLLKNAAKRPSRLGAVVNRLHHAGRLTTSKLKPIAGLALAWHVVGGREADAASIRDAIIGLTPLGFSQLAADGLGVAFESFKEQARAQRTGDEWVRDTTPYDPSRSRGRQNFHGINPDGLR